MMIRAFNGFFYSPKGSHPPMNPTRRAVLVLFLISMLLLIGLLVFLFFAPANLP
jgi:hypothetical protein